MAGKRDDDIRQRLTDLHGPPANTSVADIESRLRKLKEDLPPPPNQQDLESRLARLKGYAPSAQPNLTLKTHKPEQHQIDELLQSAKEEADLDFRVSGVTAGCGPNTAEAKGDTSGQLSEVDQLMRDMALKYQKGKTVAQRCRALRKSIGELSSDDVSDDEYTSSAKVVSAAVAEAQLDEASGCDVTAKYRQHNSKLDIFGEAPPPPSNLLSEVEQAEQLPWCCICNADATLRCLGCDDDLYCKRCFKEGHDRCDYKTHKTKPFVQN